MTVTTERPPVAPKEAWAEYTDDIIRAIKNGYMDDHIKAVALACFERRDALKEPGVSSPVIDRYPTSHVFSLPQSSSDEDANGVATCDAPGCILAMGHDEPHKAAAPRPGSSQGMRRRGRARPVDSTFRFTDGNLYNKSDIKGQTIPYGSSHPHLYVKVVGIGPRAAKVTFVDMNGRPVLDPYEVPDKYRVPNPKNNDDVIIKDPLWFGLTFIEPLVRKLQPVKES